MTKGLEKELDYLIAVKNNLCAAGLATFGGSFGFIFFNIPIFIKLPVVIIGFIITVIFLDNYFKKDDKIENIIKNLKKRGD